jgi:hypothetical protein
MKIYPYIEAFEKYHGAAVVLSILALIISNLLRLL